MQSAFIQIGNQFQTDYPGSVVEFTFGISADLLNRLIQGGPADVFASADATDMENAARAGLLAGGSTNYASNVLTIAVAPGNPKKVTAFKDLSRPGLSVAMCAPQLPCGSATTKVEQVTGVRLNPASLESRVGDVLQRVIAGQADAGLVYASSVIGAADSITVVPFPEAASAIITYPIAVLKMSKNPDTARKFIDALVGQSDQEILSAAGFAKP